ncbi:hypothetical protein V5O48_004013 [Marasmius crinis-equi]|uniref:Alpha/beta hydrolase fold-3 domain-containing protein n=1 Tax=Marasmius crinis-equi TaxID=585013 RepID=A0ABR3FR94_9AGAR
MSEYAHLSEPDPEIAPHFGALPSIPLDAPVQSLRDFFSGPMIEMINSKLGPHLPPSSDYNVTDHQVDVGGGVKVTARSIIPTPRDGEDGTFPILFWMHAGGWVLGDLQLDDYRLKILSVALRLSVVNFDYRLAPENPFPAAVDDSFAGLKFVAAHPEKFSASLKKGFIIGGASAGGGLTAVLAHLARDDPFFKDKPLTGQIFNYPVTVHPDAVPEKYKSSLLSYEQNKDAPVLGKGQMLRFFDLYKAPPSDTKISPLLLESHKGLPPAHFQVCGLDPLRDEALLYEKVLKEAGVPTKLEVYPGTPHGFEGAFFDSKQGIKFREDFQAGLKWLLQKGQA